MTGISGWLRGGAFWIVRGLGFGAVPFDAEAMARLEERESRHLLRAIAVAGFAAGNVMLLSISVWSGLGADMGAATRGSMHWISALIALPAIAYAGRPFFAPALRALGRRAMVMETPISLAVAIAAAMSLFETASGGDHVYFDAALALLFFLLIGRYLDNRARGEACATAAHLLALRSVAANVVGADGRLRSASTSDDRSLLAEIAQLTESAGQGRARHVRLADRAARIYAPAVHGLALAAFLGWTLIGGLSWQPALLIAVAVLIVTCPWALALAVPAVHVVAAAELLKRGILLKSADGLERLAAVDRVVFDKTGTLTEGRPALVDSGAVPPAALAAAATLAAASQHPLCRALLRAAGPAQVAACVAEMPGMGLQATLGGKRLKLGSRRWCGIGESGESAYSELWLTGLDGGPVRFRFADAAREDAADAVARIRAAGLPVTLLSGDRRGPVDAIARGLGIDDAEAAMSPADKVMRLAAMAEAGDRPLMVGDGLNDAPALAAGFASMSPAEGTAIAQTAADLVFQGARLAPVPDAILIARRARRLILGNFAIALGYNLIAVPLAMAGLVTPLIAAAAMSASSIAVTLNALRLRGGR